ncbi:hypothetical protein MM0349_00130 [Helicobacter pylori]
MLKWSVTFFVLVEEGSKNQNKIRIYKEGKNGCQIFKNISLWVIFFECPFMGETRQ